MSITTIGDQLVHYEALGRGQPLLFLHGWIGSWRYWWPSMQALSRHYRTFALDLWGFGDSSKDPKKYSMAAYIELLAAFFEQLGIFHPVSIVGHGLGAAVGLRYARQHPQHVDRLAAVALPIHGGYLNSRLVDNAEQPLGRLVGRGSQYPEVENELHKTDGRAVTTLVEEIGRSVFSADLDSALCPVLLVYGEEDSIVAQPSGDDARYRQGADRRAYVVLEGCQHFPMLDDGPVFNRLILDFLRTDGSLQALSPKEYWQRRTH